MTAYVMYHFNITDRSRMDELTELSLPVNEKYGAKVLIGSPVKALEGIAKSHIVVLEFNDFSAAEKYYYSDEHQELSVLINQTTEGWAAIIPGDSETQSLVDSGYFECKS